MSARALTVLTGNLLAGGVGRSHTEKRFNHLIQAAADQNPDIMCFQECLDWDDHANALWRQARERLGMRGVLGRSPTGMHTALLARPPLRIEKPAVDSGGIWHHSATRALIAWDADGDTPAGAITVVSVHLHPHSPARRLLEAEQLSALADPAHPALLAGDFNTPDPNADLTGLPAHRLVRVALPDTRVPDTRPVDRLTEAGFADLGATAHRAGDGGGRFAPTTGHWPGKPHADRPDRILANTPASAAIDAIEVVDGVAHLTDHLWLRCRVHPDRLTDRHR